MKKFKLMALSCLAVFGLASCEAPEFLTKIIPSLKKEAKVTSVSVSGVPESVTDETAPFQLVADVVVENNASKEVTWSTSNVSVATVSESGLVTPVGEGSVTITATSVADTSKTGSVTFSVSVKPAVVSVTIKGASAEGYIGLSMSLTAEVAVKGSASKAVTWKSSDESVATVSSSGVVTFKKEGSVTITATSSVDSSKSDSVTISVIYKGSHPEFVQEGYEFSKSWPEEELNNWAKISIPGIEEEGEFYYSAFEAVLETEESYGSAACFGIIAEDTDENFEELGKALVNAGFYYFYDSYNYADCFMDPTSKIEVDMSSVYLDEEETESVLCIYAYHTEDIYGSSELTSDKAWNKDVTEILEAYKVDLPFFALGKDYDVYDYEDGSFEIYDYSPVFTGLNGYGDVLLGAGFVEEDGYFVKDINAYEVAYVSLSFTTYGNTIFVEIDLKELDAFPSVEVSEYVKSIGSVFEVPSFVGDNAKFTYARTIDSKTKEVVSLNIGVFNATDAEFSNYINSLVADGYVVDEKKSYEKESGYTEVFLQKGKICVTVQLSYFRSATEEEIEYYLSFTEEDLSKMSEEEYEDYMMKLFSYLFTGEMLICDYEVAPEGNIAISSDLKAYEVPGLYLLSEKLELHVEDSLEAAKWLEVFGLDNPEIIFSSSDEEKVSVSNSGVISALAITEEPVLVTASIAETEYKVELPVTVTEVVPEGATFDFTDGGYKVSGAIGEFAYEAAKGSGSSAPATCSDTNDFKELRLYDKNTLTISSKSEIVSIKIVCNTCGDSKSGAELTCSTGSLAKTTDGYLWTGKANEVTFTTVRVGSGDAGKQCHIQSIVINGGGESGGGTISDTDPESVMKFIASLLEDVDNPQLGEHYYYYAAEDLYYVAFDILTSLQEDVEDLYEMLSYYFYPAEEPEAQTDGNGYIAFLVTEDEETVIQIDSYNDDQDGPTVEILVYANE